MFCVVLVLHDYSQLDAILDSWQAAGAPGITILPSSGMARLRQNRILAEDIPLFPTLSDFTGKEEIRNATLFSIVDDEGMVDRLVEATEAITGDLSAHNTGILFVLPVPRVHGLHRKTEDWPE